MGLAAFGLYSCYDITIKGLAGPGAIGPMQVLFCAGGFALPMVLAHLLLTGQGGSLLPVLPRWTAFRIVVTLLNGTLGAYAFTVLPLAQCYAVFFLMPLLISGLAVPLLGEHMDLPRGLAILGGLVGVAVALRPGSAPLGIGHLAAMASATLGACNYSVILKTGEIEVHADKLTIFNRSETPPWAISPADGAWARHVLHGWFEMMDLSKPLIAQVHGWCLAGGTELASACDLVYVAEDAQIGYPPVRSMSSPDMVWQPWLMGMRRAMEAMLTGDSMSGTDAVAAGFANRAFPVGDLDDAVLSMAERVAKVAPELQAINKRVVHRAMETMGMRDGMKATADLNALGFHQRASREYFAALSKNVTEALSARDGDFGDYRES